MPSFHRHPVPAEEDTRFSGRILFLCGRLCREKHPPRPPVKRALPLLLLCLLLSGAPAWADVSMQTNGQTTSLDNREENGSSRDAATFGTPPRGNGTSRQQDLQELPWGIVPEVHVPWYPGQGYRPGGRPPWLRPGWKPPGQGGAGRPIPPYPGKRPSGVRPVGPSGEALP